MGRGEQTAVNFIVTDFLKCTSNNKGGGGAEIVLHQFGLYPIFEIPSKDYLLLNFFYKAKVKWCKNKYSPKGISNIKVIFSCTINQRSHTCGKLSFGTYCGICSRSEIIQEYKRHLNTIYIVYDLFV